MMNTLGEAVISKGAWLSVRTTAEAGENAQKTGRAGDPALFLGISSQLLDRFIPKKSYQNPRFRFDLHPQPAHCAAHGGDLEQP